MAVGRWKDWSICVRASVCLQLLFLSSLAGLSSSLGICMMYTPARVLSRDMITHEHIRAMG